MNYQLDERIILTLDAGGTNFVFSAIQGNKDITKPVSYPSNADNYEKCLDTIINGFEKVKSKLTQKPVAISFAFPGPADYEKGILADLPNFPAFNGGVPLGPILEEYFNLPVFINNDGDLFAYGEALAGFLPELNCRIKAAKGVKKYKNLIGITLGTGFGCGITINNILLRGDNSCGAEIHNATNKFNPAWNAEESISTRAIIRTYEKMSGITSEKVITPEDIYNIAIGEKNGDYKAAVETFKIFGEALGSAIANVLTLIDGIVVLGGGLVGAWTLFAPSMFSELNRWYEGFDQTKYPRFSYKVFDLEDTETFPKFALGNIEALEIPGSHKTVIYDGYPRTGIGFSKLGASRAICLGAYAFALQQLDKK